MFVVQWVQSSHQEAPLCYVLNDKNMHKLEFSKAVYLKTDNDRRKIDTNYRYKFEKFEWFLSEERLEKLKQARVFKGQI